ncbi:MAG: glycosyl hydrolase family 18 protein [Bacteroidetes bacterium]|nr:glycosyl hydrolase family 18 protein [Bacteroidota bacterium]MCL5024994.1 glycosyl hydrolase family 18 protein [Chloroflexota bacterium]
MRLSLIPILCAALLAGASTLISFWHTSPASAAGPPLIRWAYWVAYDPASLASLQANIGELDYVSPEYFNMDGSGQLSGADVPAVSNIVRANGAKLVPLVHNSAKQDDFSPVLNDPALRQKAIGNLVNLVAQNNYDGIHIDFEDLSAADRAGLSQFMADLSAALGPRGKLTTIAVAAKTEEKTTGWAGAYDYAALGQSSDLVVVMTYGFRTARSAAPGSTAPLLWVDRSAAYIASRIPPNKVLLGIALWGYDWDMTKGGAAVTRNYPAIADLQARFRGTYGYDEVDQSAWMRYTDGGSDHVIWYENQRSIAAKVALAPKYDLGGYATWRLGHEGREAWSALTSFSRDIGALDWDIAKGHFFTQANGLPTGTRRKGFAITNDGGVRFWDEYQRLGGVDALGYPISRRFRWKDFTVQAFQKGVLQWRPEVNQAYFANVLDELSLAKKDSWLWTVRSTPNPLPVDFDRGKPWDQVVAGRLALMDAYPAIRDRYAASLAPMLQFGLPNSRVQDMGTHFAIRLQRAVLQLWKVNVPWAAAGTVTVANGGDLGKEAGLFPKEALVAEQPPLQ